MFFMTKVDKNYLKQDQGPKLRMIIFNNDLSVFFSSECTNKGGTSAGSCASGFGVCCTCKFCIEAYKLNSPF